MARTRQTERKLRFELAKLAASLPTLEGVAAPTTADFLAIEAARPLRGARAPAEMAADSLWGDAHLQRELF